MVNKLREGCRGQSNHCCSDWEEGEEGGGEEGKVGGNKGGRGKGGGNRGIRGESRREQGDKRGRGEDK